MRGSRFARGVAVATLCFSSRLLAANPATIDIDISKPGPAIAPTFYGLMTEEINHSYDGGLFAELIQNRTFQDPLPAAVHTKKGPVEAPPPADPPIHWSVVQNAGGTASMHAVKTDPVNSALPISLRLDLTGGLAGVANDGYWGVPIRPDTKYTATFFAKAGGGFTGPVMASLLTDDGNITVASSGTQPITTAWQKYSVTLATGHDVKETPKARFVLSASGTGSVTFSMVSLFPPTYMNTPGGLRPDLMTLMAGLHPSFIRLPGGNYLEGDYFSSRFDWKKQIGPAEERPGHMGCWSYRSSDGFGLPQYLLWCRQLGAEPILAVFAGYVLTHQSVDSDSAEMKQYVEEALQEIEYISGPADSEWGSKRVADGLAEPFKLHYVEIGNEDWFDRKGGGYSARYAVMADAIRAKYPDLKLIATAPVNSDKVDLYDDHFYRSASAMANDSEHYDYKTDGRMTFSGGHHDGAIDRNGPKYFLGEWATQEGRPTPDLNGALADAAWLMGLEKNADVIPIECYAPLLVNVNPADDAKGYPKGWQWPTNLIGYDAMTAFGSPSYYVQAMFGQNKGDVVLPTTLHATPVIAEARPVLHGGIGVGAWHTEAEYKDISVTAPDGNTLLTADLTKDTAGWTFSGDKWCLQDQAIKPAGAEATSWATIGDPSWTDYTIHLKARKISGEEGFLVLYHVQNGADYSWWNLGGWGNTRAQLTATRANEGTNFGRSTPIQIETGRWYDLRVEVQADRAKCYVDDKLITDGSNAPEPPVQPLHANAQYVTASHEAIIKVVNFGQVPMDAVLNLNGAGDVAKIGKATVLSGSPKDQNTVEEPTKVAPKEESIDDASASMHRTFPPHSLTLMRIQVEPK